MKKWLPEKPVAFIESKDRIQILPSQAHRQCGELQDKANTDAGTHQA
ncbi:MAG TPA: hypothetical protein PLR96_06730 [Flavobacteriales bacterium]|nr:hypothetical protein [Flavobacteriales bacterium]